MTCVGFVGTVIECARVKPESLLGRTTTVTKNNWSIPLLAHPKHDTNRQDDPLPAVGIEVSCIDNREVNYTAGDLGHALIKALGFV